jgi:hypothetical protein
MKHKFYLALAAMLAGLAAVTAAEFYVAPKALGSGDGKAAASAADYLDAKFWDGVVKARAAEAVTVHFTPGTYEAKPGKGKWVYLDRSFGNSAQLLTLAGDAAGGTVFRRIGENVADQKPAQYSHLLLIRNSGNMLVKNLHFRGGEQLGYGLSIRSSTDITVDQCTFKDMTGAYYGASGTSRESKNVVFQNCVFDNIGSGSHAHMIYNAYGCRDITVKNCTFRDCTGDYVRFRDKTDFATVENCTFESTGKYPEYPFICVPLFNNENPKEKPDPIDHEYFATNFLIQNNTFSRPKLDRDGRGTMLTFHHSGYNPPGKQHLISREDVAAFKKMKPEEAKKWMLERTGIDFAKVICRDNKMKNLPDEAIYESKPNYGSDQEFPNDRYLTDFSVTRLLGR